MPPTFEESEDKKQLDFYDELVTRMLSMIRKHIHQIYADESLTANNRTILNPITFRNKTRKLRGT